MKKIKFLLLPFFLFHFSTFTYGWGEVGHNIVVEIAQGLVTKNIQDSVQKYLGKMSWKSASTWMDEMRSKTRYDYMKPWHYVNIDLGKQYDTTIAEGNNVVNQLTVAILNLKNRSKFTTEETSYNLKILFHLIGDIHQPLHVGFGKDKGGNTIEVTFFDRPTNLHRVWDSDIIEYENYKVSDIQKLLSQMSEEDKRKIVNASVTDWLNQSRKLLKSVYAFKNNKIQSEYVERNKLVVESQLLNAGLRLATVLDDIFQ